MRLTSQPAFYARTGNAAGDVLTLLHLPYTAWHLSYVVIGAALANELDWLRLSGTLVAFFAGTGVAAHALDELHDRPLKTDLSDGLLRALAIAGFLVAAIVTLTGIWVISPWVVVWAAIGFVLAASYPLEWFGGRIHTDLGFALSWGAFPVLVGAWAQTGSLSAPIAGVALVATLLSLAQRALSTSARFIRRKAQDASVEFRSEGRAGEWTRAELLDTWENPLRLLTWAHIALALSLLLMRL
jgi:hypothetical protein